MAKEFNIRILPDGNIETEVKGIKGASCVDALKFLEIAINGEVKEEKKTDDYKKKEDVRRSTEIFNKR